MIRDMALVSFIYVLFLSLNLVVLSLKWYHKTLVIPFKILTVLLLLALILELCTSLFFRWSNNLFFYHVYNPIEFVLFSLFFANLSMASRTNKLIYVNIPIFLLFALISSVFIQKIDVNNSYVITVENLFIILYCLSYLRHINIYQIEDRAERNPFFWTTIGILFYSTGSLFVEGFLNLLQDISRDTARFYYQISFLFKYVMCIMFLIGISIRKHSDTLHTKG
jgi:hypothetical protein